ARSNREAAARRPPRPACSRTSRGAGGGSARGYASFDFLGRSAAGDEGGLAVDDGGADEDEQLRPLVADRAALEEPAEDRDVAEQRDLPDRFRGAAGVDAADHGGIPV